MYVRTVQYAAESSSMSTYSTVLYTVYVHTMMRKEGKHVWRLSSPHDVSYYGTVPYANFGSSRKSMQNTCMLYEKNSKKNTHLSPPPAAFTERKQATSQPGKFGYSKIHSAGLWRNSAPVVCLRYCNSSTFISRMTEIRNLIIGFLEKYYLYKPFTGKD